MLFKNHVFLRRLECFDAGDSLLNSFGTTQSSLAQCSIRSEALRFWCWQSFSHPKFSDVGKFAPESLEFMLARRSFSLSLRSPVALVLAVL